MSIFALIAERRIQEAIQNGSLDNLALKGQPLPKEDLTGVPEDLRMGYKILKNSGHLPEELQIRQDILTLQDLLQACSEPEEKATTQRKLTLRQLHYNLLMEKKGQSLAHLQYLAKLEARLLRSPKD